MDKNPTISKKISIKPSRTSKTIPSISPALSITPTRSTASLTSEHFNATTSFPVTSIELVPSNISQKESSEVNSTDSLLEYQPDETFQESTGLNFFQKSVLTVLEKIAQQHQVLIDQEKLIIDQNKLILKETKEKNSAEGNNLSQSLLQPLTGFPIHTMEEFLKLDSAENKDERRKLYLHLVNLGGSRLREFLNCALKEIMTDKLVCKFSWLGSENSRKFGDTKVANILFQAAKNCTNFKGPEDKDHFKHHMKEVLRCTKQRFRKGMKKTLSTDSTEVSVHDDDKDELRNEIVRLEKLKDKDVSTVEDFQASEEDEEDFADDES